MPFPDSQGGLEPGGSRHGPRPGQPGPVGRVRVGEQPDPTCVTKAEAKLRLDFYLFIYFKAVCALQELHPSHLRLEYNCIGLTSSYSFRSKVEAGTHRCKSNTNPLWAPILRIIKTKSAAAAAPHKTLGKHPERAANQPAGWGAIPAKNVPAGRRPHPCRWTGGGSQGSKSILKG